MTRQATIDTPPGPVMPCPDWCDTRKGSCDYFLEVNGTYSRQHLAGFTVQGDVAGEIIPLVTAEVQQCEDVTMTPGGPVSTLHDSPSITFDLQVASDEWTVAEAREMASAIHEAITKAADHLEQFQAAERAAS